MLHVTDKPLAGPGLDSYRYKGIHSWIMIGATSERDALSQASRSIFGVVDEDMLQKWDGLKYEYVTKM